MVQEHSLKGTSGISTWEGASAWGTRWKAENSADTGSGAVRWRDFGKFASKYFFSQQNRTPGNKLSAGAKDLWRQASHIGNGKEGDSMELLSNIKGLLVTDGPELRMKPVWLHTNTFLIVQKAPGQKSPEHK